MEYDGVRAEVVKTRENTFELVIFVDPARIPKVLKGQITLRNEAGDSIQVPVIGARRDISQNAKL